MSEHKSPIPSMIYNAAVGGHVTNSQQIIDENLNREQQDINEEVAAVPYNSTTPNGMGKIVLKKNDNFKQVVEAQTYGNTIFVIKYDFTLTDNITIPDNCVLEFDGGNISGAFTITGNNTNIISKSKNFIFNRSIVIAGTWNIKNIYSSWFEIPSNDCLLQFKNISLLIGNGGTNVYIENGTYNILPTQEYYKILNLKSNTRLIIEGTINVLTNSLDYQLIVIESCDNVFVFGGIINGDVKTHPGSSEGGSAIYIDSSTNITIKGVTINEIWGDGIYLGHFISGAPQNVSIYNCLITRNRRNGISVTAGKYIYIYNCSFLENGTINGTEPKASIDIEENEWSDNDYIFIKNIYADKKIYLTKHLSHTPINKTIVLSDSTINGLSINNNAVVENCHILYIEMVYDNISIKNCIIDTFLKMGNGDHLEISGCTFNNIDRSSGYSGIILVSDPVTNVVFKNNTLFFTEDGFRGASSVLPDNCENIDMINCYINGKTTWFAWNLGDVIGCTLDIGRMYLTKYAKNIINNTIKTNDLNFVVPKDTAPSCIIQGNTIIPGLNNNYQMLFVYSGVNLSNLKLIKNNLEKFDVGENRPDFMTSAEIGKEFFDTSSGVNKPIYWNGTAWVDATGTQV